jgi:hypothetical protein
MTVDQMIERIRNMQSGEPEDAGPDAELAVICMALRAGREAISVLEYATAAHLIADGHSKRSAHDRANDAIKSWNSVVQS